MKEVIVISMLALTSMISAESGSFKSCDPSKSFKMTWSPKVVATGNTYSGHLSYDVQEAELDDFEICHEMWMEDVKDAILQGCANLTCKEVIKELERFIPDAKCPFKLKNENKSFNYFLDYTAPTFEADLRVRIKLKDPKTQNVHLCIEGNIIMKE